MVSVLQVVSKNFLTNGSDYRGISRSFTVPTVQTVGDRQDRSASCFTETCQYRNRNRLWKTAKYNPVPKRNRRPTGDQALHLLNCCGDENTWTKGGAFVGPRPLLQFGREVGKLEPQIEHLQWSPKMGSDWGETEPGRGRRSYDFSYRVA
jgi:hypothetical protein